MKELNNFSKFLYLPKKTQVLQVFETKLNKQIFSWFFLRKIIYKFRTNNQSLSALDPAESTRNTPSHI